MQIDEKDLILVLLPSVSLLVSTFSEKSVLSVLFYFILFI